MSSNTSFCPDWISSPGKSIEELLQHQGLSRERFSQVSSIDPQEVDLLLEGKLSITVKLAELLQNSIGGSVEFWVARDFQYRESSERLFNNSADWLRQLPVSDMRRFGWLETAPTPANEARCCLDFFGVESVDEWHETYDYIEEAVLFRRSETFESRPASVAAWLRKGELEAESILCDQWNEDLFRESLSDIRKLTRIKASNDFLPKLKELCAKSGVALVIVRTPSGCPASGATRFLNSEKAMLMLSFRHLTDDHFWFSFFHEAAHLLLHHPGKFFIEGVGDKTNRVEEEANNFAFDIIVPKKYQNELLRLKSRRNDIVRFAKKLGVSPGLIVGQLQHHKVIDFNQQNGLKRRYEWA